MTMTMSVCSLSSSPWWRQHLRFKLWKWWCLVVIVSMVEASVNMKKRHRTRHHTLNPLVQQHSVLKKEFENVFCSPSRSSSLHTFKVLAPACSQAPPLSTFLQVPSSSSWSCGNSNPCELNPNASSNCPYFSSTRYGGERKRREWGRKKQEEGGRWVGGRKGSR